MSGKTQIIIHHNSVEKIFPFNIDIMKEVNAIKTINSKNIIKIVDFDEKKNSISYEKIIPLRKIEDQKDFIRQLCHICSALIDIHDAGYIHGDVAIGNIGINKEKKYILYDFETVKKSVSDEDRFKDIYMFMEDFAIQYKNFVQASLIIKDILKKLEDNHTISKLIKWKSFNGNIKMKKMIFEYKYDVKDFGKILIDVLKKYDLTDFNSNTNS